MGRLENIKQRGRNHIKKNRNSFIVIGCEGKNKTEEIYFKNYNNRNCIIKFSKGRCTDPVGIVKDLVKFIDSEIGREENDKYYAIFDTDVNQNKQSQIDIAKEIAEKSGVEIITTTPTFEFWYLLHFEYTTRTFLSSEEVERYLKNKINGYEKNIDTYSILKENTKKAINNAKKVEEHHLSLGQVLDNENCNPYTAVYRVVEELIKRNQ